MTPFRRDHDVPDLPTGGLTWGLVAFAIITMGALATATWWQS
jgi:hypothetical protein